MAGQHPLVAGLRLLPWGIAPFLLAPRAGALADRIGDRALAASGLVLQAAGMAWIAAIATPSVGYLALITPMSIVGAGFAIAIPAITRSVTSTTPPADIGTAFGTYATMRQLGGAFGIAIAGAAFTATGGYLTPEAFSDGFATAYAAAAAMAGAGVLAAMALPGAGVLAAMALPRRKRHPPQQPAPAQAPVTSTARTG